MNIKELEQKISQIELSGGINPDDRIDLMDMLTEKYNEISSLTDRLSEVPDEVPEPEGMANPRDQFVDDLMTRTIDLTKEIEGTSTSGKLDSFKFTTEGLRLAGKADVIIPQAEATVTGTFETVVNISNVEGAWDKDDIVTVKLGNHVIYEVADATPEAMLVSIQHGINKGDSMDLTIQIENNRSGGNKSGSAEFITFKSIVVKPA